MKVVGIDLAGKAKNPTGICILNNEKIELKTIHLDKEIFNIITNVKPELIAIDAPIIKGKIQIRKADRILKKYKAFLPTLPSMKDLTIRGSKLALTLSEICKVIEVFPTATAKILGIYNKNYKETIKNLDLNASNKHELDAYLCALTGKMHLNGDTDILGDRKGRVVIPKI